MVKRLVRGQMKSAPIAKLSACGLSLMGYRGYQLANLADHPGTRLAPVFEASESRVAAPRALGEDAELLTGPLPPIRPVLLEDVTAKSGSSFLYKKHDVLLPDEMYTKLDRISLLTNSGFFVQDYFVTKLDGTVAIPQGICAFGHGDVNWYHWLAEILPVIYLSQNLPAEFDDYPLLLPETAEKIPSFKQTLDLFRGKREVVILRDDTAYRIGRLVHVPSPVSGPFNMRDHMWPRPSDYTQNVGVVQYVRETILDALAIEREDDSPKRVILIRPPARGPTIRMKSERRPKPGGLKQCRWKS
ncbi:hypothetical protein BWR18_19410 (plasmid) [Tateyamaria omphalii]|uniref:Uncharacterized protein n=1 Tax=Tateyamaria omphalii TaxID=299262 RepID=A0A1P8N132_9RHOB|nr:hypothetical protein BWR18_19410 [Tateyamaria omphalii]